MEHVTMTATTQEKTIIDQAAKIIDQAKTSGRPMTDTERKQMSSQA